MIASRLHDAGMNGFAPEPESPAPVGVAWQRLAAIVAVASAIAVFAVYAANAIALVGYPWDWSPDEGSYLDYARRLLRAPATLYGKEVVPFPVPYTPLLPILLAPVVALSGRPLLGARLLACLWTILMVSAVYRLARRKAGPPLALAGSCLVLAPLDLSFWHMLVRIDGLMISLWLAAAVPLLPSELRRGADRLDARRMVTGVALLLAAVLAKPTAVLHGAPLVLGWLLVDRRSAVRLALSLTATGTAVLVALQVATHGGFLFVMGLWRTHPPFPGIRRTVLLFTFDRSLPILLFTLTGLALALRRGGGRWRDSTLLLCLGGLLGVLILNKAGASWNYLLPGVCATVVLATRWWGGAGREAIGSAVAAAIGLLLIATRVFPLPNAVDRETARAFYGFVKGFVHEHGKPILATWPEMAYFVADQPVEAEGSGAVYLARAGAPGTEKISASLERRDYTLVVTIPFVWTDPTFKPFIDRNYRAIGRCDLHFYYGLTPFTLLVRRGESAAFLPPPRTRCWALGAESTASAAESLP